MKKVLILASVPSMIGQFNMPNIQILQEMGYQVEAACNFADRSVWTDERIEKFRNELKDKGIKEHQIDFTRSAFRIMQHKKAYFQLKNLLVKEQYVFIHCHTPIAGALGRVAGHVAGAKIIYTAHGFHFYKGAPIKNWLVYYPIEKFLSRWTDVLITINQEDYERAKRFHAGRVEYVPGVGIDIEKINNMKVDKKEKRRELGVPEDAFVLLSVGELNKNKNHEVVIRALGKIKNPEIHYVVCGKGDLKEHLEQISRSLGIEKQVHLIGFRKDVLEIYKVCDVFVHPSFREGLPVAVMEAMASGLPCIVSDIRGNRDLVKDGKGGLHFSINSIEKLEDVIRKALQADRQKMGQYNRDKINMFGLKQMMSRNKKIYTY